MPKRLLLLALLGPLACADLPTVPETRDLPAHKVVPAGREAAAITVMSRNLYLGADIDPLFVPGGDVGEAAAAAWEVIQHTNYPARAQALAAEVANRLPHLIGLQEVVTYTVLSATPPHPPLGQIDFLAILLQALAARGLDYRVAIVVGNTQFIAPIGSSLSPDFLVHFADADAILYRGDVEIVPGSAAGANFVARTPLPLGVDIIHSWMFVDAIIADQRVRFANTHLDVQMFRAVQETQAAELIDVLADSPWPVLLAGDFNSAANPDAPEDRKTATYAMLLAAGFTDLWRGDSPDGGLTCCHTSDLSNVMAEYDQRIDLILGRNVPAGGFAGGVAMDIVGEEPGDRFTLAPEYSLWPSDHAGLVATVWLPRGLLVNR